jgi:hypothetical protein
MVSFDTPINHVWGANHSVILPDFGIVSLLAIHVRKMECVIIKTNDGEHLSFDYWSLVNLLL